LKLKKKHILHYVWDALRTVLLSEHDYAKLYFCFINENNNNIKMGTINKGKSKWQANFTGSITDSNWYWGELSDESLMTGEWL